MKVALLLAVGASSFIAFSTEQSSAACRQVFTNTTCDWLGRNCKNHFKTVCDNPAPASSLIKQGSTPQLGNAARPGSPAISGNRMIGNDGASLIGNDGATMRRK
jgi:hypothetical protein